MNNHQLKQQIRAAVEHAAPDRLNNILSSCDQSDREGAIADMSENEMRKAEITRRETGKSDLRKTESRKPGKRRYVLAAVVAVAAALLLCVGGYCLLRKNPKNVWERQIDSVIMLDVNPSLSLYVDGQETVLSVEALNDDAREVLGSMELEGTSLEVAVNAIIGSMLQKGYLGDMQNSILVSVENDDAARGEQLQQKVSDAIAGALKTDSLDAAVLSQVVSGNDKALAELAEKHHISLGKAALIQEVIAQAPELTFEELAPMTINEIALLAASKDVSSESVTRTGTASDKAYIGQDQAMKIARENAGVEMADIHRFEVEFDCKDGSMIYEVQFETAETKYEYDIDAITGMLLKFERKQNSSDIAEDNETEEYREESRKTEENREESKETEENRSEQQFTNMELEIGEGTLYIRFGDAFSLTFRDGRTVDYEIDGDTLYFSNDRSGDIVLVLPGDSSYERLRLTVKNGHVYGEAALSLENLELKVGQGEAALEDISVSQDSAIQVEHGSAFVSGDLGQNVTASCQGGHLNLEVSCEQSDCNFELEWRNGQIRLGSDQFHGRSDSRSIDNGGSRSMEFICSQGDISVEFNQ